MRLQKIRGHRRRQKQLEEWREDNLGLNMKEYLLDEGNYYQVRSRVYPWNGISIPIAQPYGKTREVILSALIDIYKEWKEELKDIKQPYYLKLWLFEPNFSKSQVVCGIGDRIEWYESLFPEPEEKRELNPQHYTKNIRHKLSEFNWQRGIEELPIYPDHLGEPEEWASYNDYIETRRMINRYMKRPHRTIMSVNWTGEEVETHLFREGYVWLGEIND